MIQVQSRLKIADNSGVQEVMCIRVLNKGVCPYAAVVGLNSHCGWSIMHARPMQGVEVHGYRPCGPAKGRYLRSGRRRPSHTDTTRVSPPTQSAVGRRQLMSAGRHAFGPKKMSPPGAVGPVRRGRAS